MPEALGATETRHVNPRYFNRHAKVLQHRPADCVIGAVNYRNFGRTGVMVSPLCLGCMMFGAKATPEESYAIVDHALDAGINFFDTANMYGRGRSEEITGEALARSGKRDKVVLATKVHHKMDDHDPNMRGNSRRHIVQQCEASLRRLKTDWIDLYQIHRPQSDVPIDETLRALDDLIRAGKILYAGTSTYGAWQLMESIMVSRELGLNRFVCEQPPYNLLDRRIERELIPFAQSYGLALIPWSPIAGGLLTGKYRKDAAQPEGTRFSNIDNIAHLKARLTPEYWDRNEAFIAYCGERGVPSSQMALAWCVQRPGITSAIVGPRTLEQLQDNLAALTVTISEKDSAKLDTIFPPGRMTSPFYDADFGPSKYR